MSVEVLDTRKLKSHLQVFKPKKNRRMLIFHIGIFSTSLGLSSLYLYIREREEEVSPGKNFAPVFYIFCD